MRVPAPGMVRERSGAWRATSAAQAMRRKKSASFWSRTSIPITSAVSPLRTESASFQMPMFTSRRPKATFGCRRKSLLRRRRMRNRSSRVRKPSQRRTSRPVSGTRLVAPSQSSTACNLFRCLVIPRDIPAMNFRQRDKRSMGREVAMANIASLFRRFYAFIVGLALFHSFANASFAQTVTQKSAVTLSKNSKLVQSQAGFYRMTIGDINVTALSDGTVGLQILDGLLLNAKSGEVQKLLAYNYQKSPIDASINAFLIRLDGKLILIDAGTAELVGPTANKLPDSLRAVGVKPEQITHIFLTHIHPDHSGGLVEGNRRVFPNATVHVDKREVDYWFDKAIAEKAAEPLKTFFSQVDAKVKPYLDSGQLKTFEGATQFFSGFRSHPTYGHTPGHSLYVLESGGDKLVFCGDLVHVGAVQFDDPSACIKFDTDPAKAAEQRKKTFADAAKNRYLLAFAHVSFPGVGHVRKEGDHYRWIPVEYMNDALKQEPRQSQGEKNMQTNEKQKAVSLL